ncbi:MAG TPA: metallophosphoesterase [Actinomycetota bacterium]
MTRKWLGVPLAALACLALLGGGTSGAATTSITVGAAGDIAWSSGPQTAAQQTAALLGQLHPNIVLPLGDEQYKVGALAEFQRSYDLTWGAFGGITYPVPGNHEYETEDAAGYRSYFGTAGKSAMPGEVMSGYYSYNIGSWHVVALDDNCEEIDCTAERQWLQSDLAADTHTCELSYEHKPNPVFFGDILRQAGVELRLTGHRHIYERQAPANGLRTIIVGTGGKSHGRFPPDLPPTTFADNKDFGILDLQLGASSYTWRFLAVDGYVDGAPNGVESGSSTCH